MRSQMPAQIPVFTSARTVEAMWSRVENAASSSPASTSFSSATLIRSAGLFFDSASTRIVSRASSRARLPSYRTPARRRTHVRCCSAVRSEA